MDDLPYAIYACFVLHSFCKINKESFDTNQVETCLEYDREYQPAVQHSGHFSQSVGRSKIFASANWISWIVIICYCTAFHTISRPIGPIQNTCTCTFVLVYFTCNHSFIFVYGNVKRWILILTKTNVVESRWWHLWLIWNINLIRAKQNSNHDE